MNLDGDCDPATNAAGEAHDPVFFDDAICEEKTAFVLDPNAYTKAECNHETFDITLSYYHLDPGCSLVNQEFEITFNNNECVTFSSFDGSQTWRYHFIYENFCVRVYGCTDNTAQNYDPNANIEDNSCEYVPESSNYTLTLIPFEMSYYGQHLFLKMDSQGIDLEALEARTAQRRRLWELDCIAINQTLAFFLYDGVNFGEEIEGYGQECDAFGGKIYDPTSICGSDLSSSIYCDQIVRDPYSCDFDTNPYTCYAGDLYNRLGGFTFNDRGEMVEEMWDTYSPGMDYFIARENAIFGFCLDQIGDNGLPIENAIPAFCSKAEVGIGQYPPQLNEVKADAAQGTLDFSILGTSGEMFVTMRGNSIELDVALAGGSSFITNSGCPLDTGFNWDIMADWNIPESYGLLDNCTGATYDPSFQCSLEDFPFTRYSEHYDSQTCGVLGGSSASYFGDLNNVYNCTQESYLRNPYQCMAGDYTGKFGSLSYDESFFAFEYFDAHPIPVDMLINKGIRVSCAGPYGPTQQTGFPLFCLRLDHVPYDVTVADTCSDLPQEPSGICTEDELELLRFTYDGPARECAEMIENMKTDLLTWDEICPCFTETSAPRGILYELNCYPSAAYNTSAAIAVYGTLVDMARYCRHEPFEGCEPTPSPTVPPSPAPTTSPTTAPSDPPTYPHPTLVPTIHPTNSPTESPTSPYPSPPPTPSPQFEHCPTAPSNSPAYPEYPQCNAGGCGLSSEGWVSEISCSFNELAELMYEWDQYITYWMQVDYFGSPEAVAVLSTLQLEAAGRAANCSEYLEWFDSRLGVVTDALEPEYIERLCNCLQHVPQNFTEQYYCRPLQSELTLAEMARTCNGWPAVTCEPTVFPTTSPSRTPSRAPTTTLQPTLVPTVIPSELPTVVPTDHPTVVPTVLPSVVPTELPTMVPTIIPSYLPSVVPSTTPSVSPSTNPSLRPTVEPTEPPTVEPTTEPTGFFECVSPYACFDLRIQAEKYSPLDNHWELYRKGTSDEKIFIAQGNFTDTCITAWYDEEVNSQFSACYSLEIHDLYGDGICCAYSPNGTVVVEFGDNIVADYFPYKHDQFKIHYMEWCIDVCPPPTLHPTRFSLEPSKSPTELNYEVSWDGPCTDTISTTYRQMINTDWVFEGDNVCANDCTIWFDGCNYCKCNDGVAEDCTRMSCEISAEPYCFQYPQIPHSEYTDTLSNDGENRPCPYRCALYYNGFGYCDCDGIGTVGECSIDVPESAQNVTGYCLAWDGEGFCTVSPTEFPSLSPTTDQPSQEPTISIVCEEIRLALLNCTEGPMNAKSVLWLIDNTADTPEWGHYLRMIETLSPHAFPAGSEFAIGDFSGNELLAMTSDLNAVLQAVQNLGNSGPTNAAVDLASSFAISESDVTIVLGSLDDLSLSCTEATNISQDTQVIVLAHGQGSADLICLENLIQDEADFFNVTNPAFFELIYWNIMTRVCNDLDKFPHDALYARVHGASSNGVPIYAHSEDFDGVLQFDSANDFWVVTREGLDTLIVSTEGGVYPTWIAPWEIYAVSDTDFSNPLGQYYPVQVGCEETMSPTRFPSPLPSTEIPTQNPSVVPTLGPTFSGPTTSPSVDPTLHPSTDQPSINPTTDQPSVSPSLSPSSEEPSVNPTVDPTLSPSTEEPSVSPTTDQPTVSPSLSPSSEEPSVNPTVDPTIAPSSDQPSLFPTTDQPSVSPSENPTVDPTLAPSTDQPSLNPTSDEPTVSPSLNPTSIYPSVSPSLSPSTDEPSVSPSLQPTNERPTINPTQKPSPNNPTQNPTSDTPSRSPSIAPTSENPTTNPTQMPSTDLPTQNPTSDQPSKTPSSAPTTEQPSKSPTQMPSTDQPSKMPSSDQPTHFPSSDLPTNFPSSQPSSEEPTKTPSPMPSTDLPTHFPTSDLPTKSPSFQPSSEHPTITPSFSPTSDIPSKTPSLQPSSEHPSISPSSDQPSFFPTSDMPSKTPSSQPSSDHPSFSPTSDMPSKTPSSQPSS